MGQTYASITVASDTGATIFTTLKDRTDTLRSNWSATAAPGSPVDGQTFADTTTAGDVILSFYNGTTWVEIGSVLHTDLEFGTSAIPKQAKFARLENRTGQITPAAAQIGRVYLFTTDAKGRLVVSDSVREVLMSGSSVDYFAPSFIPISACDLDATNPPTAATIGTTPTIRGKQFDATNEKCSFGFFVPAGYSADADCKVRVWAYLLNGETDNDTIDATLDIRTVKPNNEEVPTGTSTQAVVAYSIGTGNTQYSLHKFDFTIDFDDASNPVEAGDWVECEFSLSSIASVTGIIVRGFQPLVTFGTKVTE